ncbi:TNF receptor-associated factor 5-like [Haemaphysalis longicornis]
MAHARQEFALVGYSEDLEKRPLKFVDAIPVARICSACGSIPRWTYTLLCGHIFCEPCYQSCATASECVCPLDGDACAPADVSSKEYPADNLLSRKVHCWNEASGCGVVLPASQIAQHYRQECQYHVTNCPTCTAAVLSRDVCAHLKSLCSGLVFHAAPEAPHGTDANERGNLVAFERKVEQRVSELDAKLVQLSLETGSQSDKLVEFCHNVNHLNETQKQQFEALSRQFEGASVQIIDCFKRSEAEMKAMVAPEKAIEKRVGDVDAKLNQLSLKCDSLSEKLSEICHNDILLKEALTEQFGPTLERNVAEIKSLYAEKSESFRATITSALASVSRDQKTHQRVVTGYATLKEEASKDGWSWSMSDKVYLRGYHMSWGVVFLKEGGGVSLWLCVQLHEGTQDDFLDWPFRKELKLSIVHPETRQERNLNVKPIPCDTSGKHLSRPIKTSNLATRFGQVRAESSDIERDGYVKEDQLLLRFEVVL